MPKKQMRRGVALAMVVFLVGGCSWFARKPKATPQLAVVQTAGPVEPAGDAAAAKAACTNYATAMAAVAYPRDAIIRGIDTGRATVRFRVAGSNTTIVSVTSSDPAFGAAAADVVRKFDCRAELPTIYEVPFAWRSVR